MTPLPWVLVAWIAASVAACDSVATTALPVPASAPASRVEVIEHATGHTDVVLRYDRGPDEARSELTGHLFQPGPEFTLYGDGTVIFRSDRGGQPQADGSILRASPFLVARLREDQIQSLLGFALADGGLRSATGLYDEQVDTDNFGVTTFSIHADGVNTDVRVVGSAESPFGELEDLLRNFDRDPSIRAEVWAPRRYWGVLFEAGTWTDLGVLPKPAELGTAAWPWPAIQPADYLGIHGPDATGRRLMDADDAGVLGLSHRGGVVMLAYVTGPRSKMIYGFSLWPLLPDDPFWGALGTD